MSLFCLAHGIESSASGDCVLPIWSDEEQRVVGFRYVRLDETVVA